MSDVLSLRSRREGFGARTTAEEVTRGLDLTGRTIAITGCNSGLGYETTRALSARGARVIGLARTIDRAKEACARHPGATPIACDLAEPGSVLSAVDSIRSAGDTLDAIIANAGIMATPKLELVHGYERQFFTNHVAHHLLVTRLLDRLAPEGRVVVLSSSLHASAPPEGIRFDDLDGRYGYSPWTAYGRSKLANILFAKHLSGRLPRARQTANAVHPGVVRTNLQRDLGPGARVLFAIGSPFFKTVQQGASTPVFAAVHPAAARMNGGYLADCRLATPSAQAEDSILAARLWNETERILSRLGVA